MYIYMCVSNYNLVLCYKLLDNMRCVLLCFGMCWSVFEYI